jgi:hypothetical protein
MWILVYIKLLFPEPGLYDVDAQIYGTYKTFDKCAMSRDMVILDQGYIHGYPAPDTQFVCIRHLEKK